MFTCTRVVFCGACGGLGLWCMGVCLRVCFFLRLRQAALVVQQYQITHTTARKVVMRVFMIFLDARRGTPRRLMQLVTGSCPSFFGCDGKTMCSHARALFFVAPAAGWVFGVWAFVCVCVFFCACGKLPSWFNSTRSHIPRHARWSCTYICVCVPSREADKQVQHTLFLMP